MNPETFAAERRESLRFADDAIREAVAHGLTRYANGEDNWWGGIVNAAAQVWVEHYQAEAPGTSHVASLARFRESMAESLSKTAQPDGVVTPTQIERVTRWASTLTVNSGTVTGAFRRGIKFKRWTTMHDDEVREIHRPLDGQVVPIGSTWNVNGSKLGFPGEPVGPPEGWIECRCVAMPASREGETMSANTFTIGPDDRVEDDNPDIVVGNNIVAAGDLANPDGTPYTGALIVLVPADDDPIVAASSEHAHITTVWMGEVESLDEAARAALAGEVRSYATALDGPVVVPVMERGTLGDDDADVVFLERTDALVNLRGGLIDSSPTVQAAYDAAEQFPEWTPHVTLGYPDRPAKGEYDATEVTFDRLSLWLGGEHFDYPMGGTVTAAATVTEAPVDDVEDDEPDETIQTEIPIHGVLAPEGILSGDGRGFRPGAVSSRKLPLHYRYEFVGSHGGNQTSQAVTVGRLDEVFTHTDGMVRFRGVIDMTRPYADQALIDIMQGIGFNSIDADAMEQDVSMYFDADGNMIDQEVAPEDMGKMPETWYSKVRVAGLTQVPIQAFPETYTALGWDFEEDMTDEQLAASAAALEDCGCTDPDRVQASADMIVDLTSLSPDDFAAYQALSAEQQDEYVREHDLILASGSFAPGTKDGPGWITNPRATSRIRRYWTQGEGAAKIGWGTPGDFNRCRALLGKYVQNPDWLAGLCANMHYEVLKTWPGRKRGDKGHALAASGASTRDSMTLVASADRLYSSAAFAEPAETRAFPMRINRETREISGYAAQWGSCHIGIGGMCQEAPRSHSDYSYYRKGIVETDAGEQSVGLLTYGIGHADQRMHAAAATAHYDQTDAVRAYINIGENAYGIWYAGVLAPWVTDDDIDAMLAIRRVSGDWRNWSGRRDDLEMVGLVVVNTEGFQLAASAALDGMVGGVQTVAIGIGAVDVGDEPVTAAASGETHEQFVNRLATEVRRQMQYQAHVADVRRRVTAFRATEVRRKIEEMN